MVRLYQFFLEVHAPHIIIGHPEEKLGFHTCIALSFRHSMLGIRNQGKFTRAYKRLSDTLSLSYGLLYPSIEQTSWASTIPKFREQTAPYWLLYFISKRPLCGVWPFTRRTSEAKFERNGMELKKRKHKYKCTEILIKPSINSIIYLNISIIKYWLQCTCRW